MLLPSQQPAMQNEIELANSQGFGSNGSKLIDKMSKLIFMLCSIFSYFGIGASIGASIGAGIGVGMLWNKLAHVVSQAIVIGG